MFKKILAWTLLIALTATATIGGTLAYLQDSDAQVNTFTTGDVHIDLWEDFGDNSGIEKLIPTTGKDDEGNVINAVEKEVYVTNTGSEDAYVRVHIAIPQILDDVNSAGNNTLHFNYGKETIGASLWDWSKTTDAPYDGDWNSYPITIDGVAYNVYVVTYGSVLAPGQATIDAMNQVYLDKSVDNKNVKDITAVLGNEWKIYVLAEGTQADGFEDAYTALNTAFGEPGTYPVEWNVVTGGKVNTTFVESDSIKSTPDVVTEDVESTSTDYGYYNAMGTTTHFNDVNMTTSGGALNVRGNATWNGGSITTNSATTNPRHIFYVAAREGLADGHLTINSGEFTFNPTNLTRKGSYICADGGTVIVNGGTFHKPSTRTAPIQVLNGGSVTIYGGSFQFDPSAFVAEGYQAVESNGWWTVSAI